MSKITYMGAIHRALDEELARDENLFLFGEDVGCFGGCFGVTKGLWAKYGDDRLIDTPISEAMIGAAAMGAAFYGKRVCAEMMFADFMTLCSDTLMNMAGSQRYLAAGQLTCPLTIRAPQGGGVSAGAHHSQDVTSWFLNAPGLTIVCPTTPDEVYSLLKASIRYDGPVLFLEHKKLYGTKGEVGDTDHVMELGKARVVKEGSDITIIANQLMRLYAEEAIKTLEADGISVELIDPLTIKRYDKDTMASSVNKTGRALIVTESRKTGSYAAEFATELSEACFANLKKPIKRLCTMDLPIVKGAVEAFIQPSTESIIAAVKELMA